MTLCEGGGAGAGLTQVLSFLRLSQDFLDVTPAVTLCDNVRSRYMRRCRYFSHSQTDIDLFLEQTPSIPSIFTRVATY